MKVSLWLGPNDRHLLRFDDLDLEDVARLMQAVGRRQAVQISDYHRNILGTWEAGDLRDASAELSRLMRRWAM